MHIAGALKGYCGLVAVTVLFSNGRSCLGFVKAVGDGELDVALHVAAVEAQLVELGAQHIDVGVIGV